MRWQPNRGRAMAISRMRRRNSICCGAVLFRQKVDRLTGASRQARALVNLESVEYPVRQLPTPRWLKGPFFWFFAHQRVIPLCLDCPVIGRSSHGEGSETAGGAR